MTRKYDLHYQSCPTATRLRNNRFSRSEIRKLVFAINIADIGLILKQINTGTRQQVTQDHLRPFRIIKDQILHTEPHKNNFHFKI